MIKRNGFLFLMLIMMVAACIPDEPNFDGFRRVELQRLLSGGEVKKWKLVERVINNENVVLDSCENLRQLIFGFTPSGSDNDLLQFVNYQNGCIQDADTVNGFWFIPTTQTVFIVTDTLALSREGDTTFFIIDQINAEKFEIRTMDSDSIFEAYEYYIEPDTIASDTTTVP